jgi:nucleotide-binding universal stress UspA family protein
MASKYNSASEKLGTIKKILAAIDKSGYRNKVIETGTILAKALGASMIVIHVIDRTSLGVAWDLLSYYPGMRAEMYEKGIKKESEKLLTEVKDFVQAKGIQLDVKLISDVPSAADGIIDYAKEANVDLIIVGTKGMSGIERFLMGSVAVKVVSHAHCPVLAVR